MKRIISFCKCSLVWQNRRGRITESAARGIADNPFRYVNVVAVGIAVIGTVPEAEQYPEGAGVQKRIRV